MVMRNQTFNLYIENGQSLYWHVGCMKSFSRERIITLAQVRNGNILTITGCLLICPTNWCETVANRIECYQEKKRKNKLRFESDGRIESGISIFFCHSLACNEQTQPEHTRFAANNFPDQAIFHLHKLICIAIRLSKPVSILPITYWTQFAISQ